MRAVYILALTLVMQIIQVLSSILNIKFAYNSLNSSDMAIWIIYLSILPFLIVFDGNLSVTLSREIAFSKKLKNNLVRITNLKNSSDYIVKVALLYFLVCINIIFVSYYFFSEKLEESIIFPTYIYILALILRLKSNYSLSKLFAFDLIIYDRLVKIISTIINLFLIYYFLNNGLGLYSLGLAFFIQSFIVIGISKYILYIKYTFILIKRKYRIVTHRLLNPTREYLLIAIPGILVLNSGIFFLNFFDVDNDILISYGLSIQVFTAIVGLTTILPSTFQPMLSRAYAIKNDFKNKALQLLVIYYTLVFGIMINIYVFKNDFFILWLGNNNVDNIIFNSLFFVYLFEMIQIPLTIFSIAIGYFKFAKITAFSSFLILLITYPFFYIFGYYSVALVVFVVQILTCHQYNIRKFLSLYNITFQDFIILIKRIILPILSILILTILFRNLEIIAFYKILISSTLTILVIGIFFVKDLKRISQWI